MDIYADKKAVAELNSVYMEAVYGQSAGQKLAQRERDDDAAGAPNKKKMVVTAADKKANTPAYQNYKKGDKRYTAADHLNKEEATVVKKEIKDLKGGIKGLKGKESQVFLPIIIVELFVIFLKFCKSSEICHGKFPFSPIPPF